MKVAVAGTKGGTGKTTTAVFLAAALARQGRTLLVDTDPQCSATTWSEVDETQPGWPFNVWGRATTDVHRSLPSMASDYEHVVIDTPPGNVPIIKSACMAADVVVVPVSPTGLDVNRLRPTWELLADVEVTHSFVAGVLLTKVRRGTVSARSVRDILAGVDYPVLTAEVPLAEMYAASFGFVPVDLGAYEDVAKELLS